LSIIAVAAATRADTTVPAVNELRIELKIGSNQKRFGVRKCTLLAIVAKLQDIHMM